MITSIFRKSSNGYAVMDSADSTLTGRKIMFEDNQRLKTISLHYLLSGATNFSVYLRFFNGRVWLGWNLLTINDADVTSVFSDASASGVEIGFIMRLQACDFDGMQGCQIELRRGAGAGSQDITISRGYAVIE